MLFAAQSIEKLQNFQELQESRIIFGVH